MAKHSTSKGFLTSRRVLRANTLGSAIMKYHGHKMMEINDTAQALWNKCYQGTDIDTIMIKSDSDNVTKVGNRSYNYRVSSFYRL